MMINIIMSSLIELALLVIYALMLSGVLPKELAVVLSMISIILFKYHCDILDELKKNKWYYVRDFIIVVFYNILLLPYIQSSYIRWSVEAVLFILGLIVTIITLVSDKTEENRNKKIGIYVITTLIVGLVFEIGRKVIPMILSEYRDIIYIVLAVTMIIVTIILYQNKKK